MTKTIIFYVISLQKIRPPTCSKTQFRWYLWLGNTDTETDTEICFVSSDINIQYFFKSWHNQQLKLSYKRPLFILHIQSCLLLIHVHKKSFDLRLKLTCHLYYISNINIIYLCLHNKLVKIIHCIICIILTIEYVKSNFLTNKSYRNQ